MGEPLHKVMHLHYPTGIICSRSQEYKSSYVNHLGLLSTEHSRSVVLRTLPRSTVCATILLTGYFYCYGLPIFSLSFLSLQAGKYESPHRANPSLLEPFTQLSVRPSNSTAPPTQVSPLPRRAPPFHATFSSPGPSPCPKAPSLPQRPRPFPYWPRP